MARAGGRVSYGDAAIMKDLISLPLLSFVFVFHFAKKKKEFRYFQMLISSRMQAKVLFVFGGEFFLVLEKCNLGKNDVTLHYYCILCANFAVVFTQRSVHHL